MKELAHLILEVKFRDDPLVNFQEYLFSSHTFGDYF